MSNLDWKQKLLDFSLVQKASVLKQIHQIVEDGVYGKDYTIAPREKNKKLRVDYWLSDEKIKEILLSLRIEEFIEIDDSDNENHIGDIVCIFQKKYLLMPRWKENSDYEMVSLYIKITKPKNGELLFIISFHEAEYEFE